MVNIEALDAIGEELGYFKFNRNSMGYEYLIESIYIVTTNNLTIKDFGNEVYPTIAKKYRTESRKVLWCISKLLNLMYINTDEKIIREYFKLYYNEKPTPKAFIIGISKKVNRKIMCKKERNRTESITDKDEHQIPIKFIKKSSVKMVRKVSKTCLI